MKLQSATIEMKAIEQYFHVLHIMLCRVVLTLNKDCRLNPSTI